MSEMSSIDFVVHQLGNALDQPGLVDLVGNLRDDDRLAVFVESLDGGAGAHHEASATGSIGIENSALAVNDAGSRKVRTLHEFQNVGELRGGIVHQGNGRVHDFREIVRRDVGRHAHRDAIRTVDQKVWNAGGENVRLNFAAVIVGAKVDGFLVEIL